MSKWLLAAMSVVVLGLGVALWRGLSEDPADVPALPIASAPAVTPPAPAPSPVRTRPKVARVPAAAPSPSAAPADSADEDAERTEREAVQRFVSEVVPRELYATAADCYRGEEGDHEALELSYHLSVADAIASVTDVRVERSTLDRPGLEGCITSALSGHTWDVADGFTVDQSGETLSITINGLRKLHRQRAGR